MRSNSSPSRTRRWRTWKVSCFQPSRWHLERISASTASRSTACSAIAPRTACTRVWMKRVQRCANCRNCSRSRNRITDRSSACEARTGNNAYWTSQINVLEYKLIAFRRPTRAPRLTDMPMAVRALFAVFFGLFIGACAQAPLQPSPGHVQPSDQPVVGKIPAPVQISTVLPKPKPALKPETYSVVVNSVNVQELLFALARDAKLNVDVNPGIKGVVTLNAIDQTLPQLLSRIAKQVDMRWELDGPNLAIMPDTPYLRLYKIDYVNLDRKTTGVVGASAQVTASVGGSGGGGGAGGGGGGGTNTSTITVTNSASNTLWATLERNIKDILHETDKVLPSGASGAPQAPAAPTPLAAPGAPAPSAPPVAPNITFREAASVIVNPEAGVVTIRATSRQHEKIQEFIDQVMASVKRQVLIEATIVEVQLNNQFQRGIDWSIMRSGTTGISLSQASSTAGLPSAPSLPSIFTIDTAAAHFGNLSAIIRLLDSFGTGRVLSSPKLSVLNNQTAVLRVVDNLVYFEVRATVTGATQSSPALTSFSTTVQSVPIGFLMNVTPQISDTNTILLNVKPTVTRLLRYIADPNPSLGSIQNLVPQTRMREMESLIKVNSGQIAVLGGLIEDSVNDAEDTVPGLNQLPILGSL